MKVLAVFTTVGKDRRGFPFSGQSNRVFDLDRLDEEAIVFMEGTLALEGTEDLGTIDRALITNVIALEG